MALYGQSASRHPAAHHAHAAGVHREAGSLTRWFSRLFLAFEALLFGALFVAYFTLRAGSITWGWSPHRDLALVNTVVLLASTTCFWTATAAARHGRLPAFRWLTFTTLVLGATFLGVKAYEYVDDFALALYPRTSTRIALYYLVSGVHAAHVLGGLIVSAWLARTPRSVWLDSSTVFIKRAEATLLFWMFLCVIWIIVVVLFYVW